MAENKEGNDMGYWKWLGGCLKALKPWQLLRDAVREPLTEAVVGGVGLALLLVFSTFLGILVDRVYFLLFLGIIPCILIILHAWHREKGRYSYAHPDEMAKR